MNTRNNYVFCMRLLKAETEDEVIRILKEYNYWEDRICGELGCGISRSAWSFRRPYPNTALRRTQGAASAG